MSKKKENGEMLLSKIKINSYSSSMNLKSLHAGKSNRNYYPLKSDKKRTQNASYYFQSYRSPPKLNVELTKAERNADARLDKKIKKS